MVESAIIMPLMVFLILGTVQLVMMQHARIMTEYAAYNSARAGIVWNADKIIMENAAIISLLPTYEGLLDESGLANPVEMLRKIGMRALLYQVNRRIPQAVGLLQQGAGNIINGMDFSDTTKESIGKGVNDVLNAAGNMGNEAAVNAIGAALGANANDSMISVTILSPTLMSIAGNNSEKDFDSVKAGDRDANRLTIRLRYYYMMRVPFANWVIHQAWMAGRAARNLSGAIWNPQEVAGETGFRDAGGVGSFAFADPEMATVSALASEGVYVIPIVTTHTMRMQSNVYRNSLSVF